MNIVDTINSKIILINVDNFVGSTKGKHKFVGNMPQENLAVIVMVRLKDNNSNHIYLMHLLVKSSFLNAAFIGKQQVRIQDLVKGGAPGAEAESCRRSEAELHERSELLAAGVQGPLKGPGSFWVFNAQICILPHSRDSFSLIFDIYFNTKS